MKILFSTFLWSLLLLSCGKEEFTKTATKSSTQASPIQQSTQNSCSNFTLVKPPVDILFVIDNTETTNFISAQTKSALQSTINLVSNQFDYRIMVAPLVDDGNSRFPIVLADPSSISCPASPPPLSNPNCLLSRVVPADNINFFSQVVGGSREWGFQRVLQVIRDNMNGTSNVFRRNAYTIVVLVSNGDDTDFTFDPMTGLPITSHFNARLNDFVSLIGSPQGSNTSTTQLNASTFRFLSIVPHSTTCYEGYRWWSLNSSSNAVYQNRYIEMSRRLYQISGSQDQSGKTHPDSYDLCSGNFAQIFEDGINKTIQQVVVGHKYNFWPVSTNNNFDIQQLRVFKNGVQLTANDTQNGFVFHNTDQTRNTRFAPSAGEPFTGYLVELFGNAQVTYPECIMIQTQTPADYYGYVALSKEPDLSSVILEINGVRIPQSSTDGWTYFGYSPSLNVRVKSRTDLTTAEPGIFRSGYFLKLHGNAVYTNSDRVDARFIAKTR